MTNTSAINKPKIEKNENKFEVPTWREILKRIPNARNDWNQKKPLQKFGYLYGIGKMGMDEAGYSTFRTDQTLTAHSYFAWICGGIHTILMFYTCVSYIRQGMFTKGLPCTCFVMGCVITVS